MTILPSRAFAPATQIQNGWPVKPISEVAALEIPGNVTVPQFLFNSKHFARLDHFPNAPWLIDSVSGRALTGDEVSIAPICLQRKTFISI